MVLCCSEKIIAPLFKGETQVELFLDKGFARFMVEKAFLENCDFGAVSGM
jgi:hypothetical protein